MWTRRDILSLLLISTVPTVLYVYTGCDWLALPWLPIALLGTAVAFVVGFKNNASYDRMWEARKAWGGIVNTSRAWGIMVHDFIHGGTFSENELHQEKLILIRRHVAWMTALRFQLREAKSWEAVYKKHNAEYREKYFKVEEHNSKLADTLKNYLSEEEFEMVMKKANKPAQIIALQSQHLRKLQKENCIDDFRHMELEKVLVELLNQQGVSERIKNFPYPRQFATLNLYFIRIFIILVPLGMLQEFQKLGENMIWLSIPFSALSSWIFTTMEKIGESTESPFEGSANDVPITAMSRAIEIDLLEMFDQRDIPEPKKSMNDILV